MDDAYNRQYEEPRFVGSLQELRDIEKTLKNVIHGKNDRTRGDTEAKVLAVALSLLEVVEWLQSEAP